MCGFRIQHQKTMRDIIVLKNTENIGNQGSISARFHNAFHFFFAVCDDTSTNLNLHVLRVSHAGKSCMLMKGANASPSASTMASGKADHFLNQLHALSNITITNVNLLRAHPNRRVQRLSWSRKSMLWLHPFQLTEKQILYSSVWCKEHFFIHTKTWSHAIW